MQESSTDSSNLRWKEVFDSFPLRFYHFLFYLPLLGQEYRLQTPIKSSWSKKDEENLLELSK